MKAPDVRVIVGVGGSGKSHLAKHQLTRRGRVLIHDPNAEYPDVERTADRAALVTWLRERPARIRAAWLGDVEFLNRVAWAAGDVTVVWDEADEAFAGRPFSSAAFPFAWAVAKRGRHRGISLFVMAQRPAGIPRHVTANATRIAAFATQEPADVDYLRYYMGREAAAAVTALAPYHAVDWRRGGGWSVKKSPFD